MKFVITHSIVATCKCCSTALNRHFVSLTDFETDLKLLFLPQFIGGLFLAFVLGALVTGTAMHLASGSSNIQYLGARSTEVRKFAITSVLSAAVLS